MRRGLVGGATDCQSHVAAQHYNRLNTPGLNARSGIEDGFCFRDLRKLIRDTVRRRMRCQKLRQPSA